MEANFENYNPLQPAKTSDSQKQGTMSDVFTFVRIKTASAFSCKNLKNYISETCERTYSRTETAK